MAGTMQPCIIDWSSGIFFARLQRWDDRMWNLFVDCHEEAETREADRIALNLLSTIGVSALYRLRAHLVLSVHENPDWFYHAHQALNEVQQSLQRSETELSWWNGCVRDNLYAATLDMCRLNLIKTRTTFEVKMGWDSAAASWQQARKIYIKVNGSWRDAAEEITDNEDNSQFILATVKT